MTAKIAWHEGVECGIPIIGSMRPGIGAHEMFEIADVPRLPCARFLYR